MSQAEHAVALKLPIFWTSQPEVWFVQTEAQFTLRGITVDETKYFHVVAALDQDTATRLIDFISRPPEENRYGALKARLLSTFGLDKRERATRLLHFRPLGDSKPSALMDEMLAFLGDHPPCFLFEQLFLERLPEDIRLQLAGVDKVIDYRDLAKRADAFWTSRDSVQRPMASMANALANAVHRPPSNEHKTPYNKSSKHQQYRDTKPKVGNPSQLCYYHRTFGDAARQCRQPCSWTGNDKASR